MVEKYIRVSDYHKDYNTMFNITKKSINPSRPINAKTKNYPIDKMRSNNSLKFSNNPSQFERCLLVTSG